MSELARLESISDWYIKDQIDFDKKLIRFRYQSLKPYFVGKKCLELGTAQGVMTRLLVQEFEQITVVDASNELLEGIENCENLLKVQSLFEDFVPTERFDSVIMDHILEHVENPAALLGKVVSWLAPNGRIFIGVPNGNSFHRLVAVKMGLLRHMCELNSRDLTLGHRRVYTKNTLLSEVIQAGLKPIAFGGVFFKPLSNQQIQEHWTAEMIDGFYELGKDFPDHAAEIFFVCEK